MSEEPRVNDEGLESPPGISMRENTTDAEQNTQLDLAKFENSLKYVNTNYDIPYYWSFGPAGIKTFFKRVVRKILKCLIPPILEKQNQFNAHVVRCLNAIRDLFVRVNAQAEEIVLLKQELSARRLETERQIVVLREEYREEIERQIAALREECGKETEKQIRIKYHEICSMIEFNEDAVGELKEDMDCIKRVDASIFSGYKYQENFHKYSQSGEDSIVAYIFKSVGIRPENVSYLDLGANHARDLNNTYYFYRSGASGVLVEANPNLIPELRLLRSRDIILNNCISSIDDIYVNFYVTSDPKDQIFALAEAQPRIRPYYIGEKRLITLMMKMDADMVVMTMPDLENYHIKRSYVRKDVEYVYMVHYGIGSSNLLLRQGALAHFDTIFCAGEQQLEELREEEQVYGLAPRNLVPCGYGLLDRVMAAYEAMPKQEHEKPQILIAPSWQKDNILDTCIDPLLESLLCDKYRVILRPHPEYCKRFPQKIADLQGRYKSRLNEDFIIQTDFSSNETVFQSDLVITDWSTICYEFSFATKRPALFVDTPMKIMNPEYKRLKTVPMDIRIRQEIGRSIKPENAGVAGHEVSQLLKDRKKYEERIDTIVERSLYNRGKSGAAGGQYILDALVRKEKKQR